MKLNNKRAFKGQLGFSLIELLVGLVIGLLATLVIMQTFSAFEGQKRSTTGSADAQTNGSIALNLIQREMQLAGFGLPVSIADADNASLKCDPSPVFDHDEDAATPALEIFPLFITEGANSDSINVRYSTLASAPVPVKITNASDPTDDGLAVDNNIGCNANDIVLIAQGSSCILAKISAVSNAPDKIVLDAATPVGAPVVNTAKITCMGDWNTVSFEVENNTLVRNGEPIVSEIVNMQAQYGISATANSNNVVSWVNATDEWAAPTVEDRNRIKAVRIAIVARNGLLEKDEVTAPCTTAGGTENNGPCAWDDTGLDAAPVIDLSGDENWKNYRYRSFETIIPIRNMLWSRDAL